MGVSRDTEEPSRLPTWDPRPLSRWAGEGQQPPAPRARLAARRQRLCSLTTHGLAACPQGLAASCCPGPAGRQHEVGHRSAVPSWCLSCMGLGDGARAGGTRGLGLQLPPTLWPRGGPLPPCRSFFTRRMGAKPHAQLGASAGPGFTQRRVRSPVGRRLGRGSGSPGAAWPDLALWGPLGGQGSGALGLDVASFSSWHPWAELGSPVVGLHPREALRPPTSRPLGVSPGHVAAEPHGVGMARPWPGSHSPSQAQASCPASPQRGRCAPKLTRASPATASLPHGRPGPGSGTDAP